MAYQMVECNNCNKVCPSVYRGNVLITIILLLCYVIPGIIYMVWRRSGIGVCSNCRSPNVIPYVARKSKNTVQDTHRVFESTVAQEPQMRCPECRELILVGARKCKHCGSEIRPVL